MTRNVSVIKYIHRKHSDTSCWMRTESTVKIGNITKEERIVQRFSHLGPFSYILVTCVLISRGRNQFKLILLFVS